MSRLPPSCRLKQRPLLLQPCPNIDVGMRGRRGSTLARWNSMLTTLQPTSSNAGLLTLPLPTGRSCFCLSNAKVCGMTKYSGPIQGRRGLFAGQSSHIRPGSTPLESPRISGCTEERTYIGVQKIQCEAGKGAQIWLSSARLNDSRAKGAILTLRFSDSSPPLRSASVQADGPQFCVVGENSIPVSTQSTPSNR